MRPTRHLPAPAVPQRGFQTSTQVKFLFRNSHAQTTTNTDCFVICVAFVPSSNKCSLANAGPLVPQTRLANDHVVYSAACHRGQMADSKRQQLAGWLAGWLADWLVGWLAGWLAGWPAGWPAELLAGWLAGWLISWLHGELVACWLAGELAG
jgi:hypothetical protein